VAIDQTIVSQPDPGRVLNLGSPQRGGPIRQNPFTSRRLRRPVLHAWQLGILVAFLAAWQWLPDQLWLRHRYKAFNPFFVSSPSAVAKAVFDLLTGTNGQPLIWPYIRFTVEGTLVAELSASCSVPCLGYS